MFSVSHFRLLIHWSDLVKQMDLKSACVSLESLQNNMGFMCRDSTTIIRTRVSDSRSLPK